jgi:hypothetical protein
MKRSDSVSSGGERLEKTHRPIHYSRSIRSRWTFPCLVFALLVFPQAFVIFKQSKWSVFDGIDLGSVGEHLVAYRLSKSPEQKARQLLKKYPLIGEKSLNPQVMIDPDKIQQTAIMI